MKIQQLLKEAAQSMMDTPEWKAAGVGPHKYITAKDLAAQVDNEYQQGDADFLGMFQRNRSGQALEQLLAMLGIDIADYEDLGINHPTFYNSKNPMDSYMINRGASEVGLNAGSASYKPGADKQIYKQLNPPFMSESVQLNETTLYEIGQVVEAAINLRGLSKKIKLFYPSMRAISRSQLQEDINRVLPGVTVVSFTRLQHKNSKIASQPVILVNEHNKLLTESSYNPRAVLNEQIENGLSEVALHKLHLDLTVIASINNLDTTTLNENYLQVCKENKIVNNNITMGVSDEYVFTNEDFVDNNIIVIEASSCQGGRKMKPRRKKRKTSEPMNESTASAFRKFLVKQLQQESVNWEQLGELFGTEGPSGKLSGTEGPSGLPAEFGNMDKKQKAINLIKEKMGEEHRIHQQHFDTAVELARGPNGSLNPETIVRHYERLIGLGNQ